MFPEVCEMDVKFKKGERVILANRFGKYQNKLNRILYIVLLRAFPMPVYPGSLQEGARNIEHFLDCFNHKCFFHREYPVAYIKAATYWIYYNVLCIDELVIFAKTSETDITIPIWKMRKLRLESDLLVSYNHNSNSEEYLLNPPLFLWQPP